MFHRLVTGLAVMLLWAITPCAQAGAESVRHIPLTGNFDKDVREARLEMREYCALTQKMMKLSEVDTVTQAKALDHLRNCRLKWDVVVERYSTNPPAQYTPDDKFRARLTDIAGAMDDMERHLRDGRPAKSFQACSHACGLFVSMHEENNLVYGLDRIFHLRKLAKTVASAGAIGGPTAIRDLLPELMHQRNRILAAPCPWPGDRDRCIKYRASVKVLSGAIDDLAICTASGDTKEASEVLQGMIDMVNRAYESAL